MPTSSPVLLFSGQVLLQSHPALAVLPGAFPRALHRPAASVRRRDDALPRPTVERTALAAVENAERRNASGRTD
eukprot:3531969-Rhodomonas_salina.1